MNNLEFINKEIEATKRDISIWKVGIETKKYLKDKLQTLQQIKTELEAWEIVKKDFILTWEEPNNASGYYLNYFGDCEYKKIKKALEVKR